MKIVTMTSLKALLISMNIFGASKAFAMDRVLRPQSRISIGTPQSIVPQMMNVASCLATAGMAWSSFRDNNKLAVCCGIFAIATRYMAYRMTKNVKSPKPKSKSGGTYCYANILDDEEDHPEKVYTMPKSLKDPEWKRLFTLTAASNSVPKALMILVQQRLARKIDDDEAFFVRVAEIVGPALQRVEFLESHAYAANFFTGDPELVAIKKPHSNFYPVSTLSANSDLEDGTAFLPITYSDTSQRGPRILMRERPKADQGDAMDVYHDINTFAHEMVHVARIDAFHTNRLDRERQADLLSGLALRSDEFFLGRLYGFIGSFNTSEQIRYYAARNNTYALAQLIVEPVNDQFSSAYITLLNRYNYYSKNFAERLKFLRNDSLMDLIVANIKENDARESTHPPIFERIQNNLTVWASFLIHIKKMRQNAAIDHIAKLSQTLHNKFYKDRGYESAKQVIEYWTNSQP